MGEFSSQLEFYEFEAAKLKHRLVARCAGDARSASRSLRTQVDSDD